MDTETLFFEYLAAFVKGEPTADLISKFSSEDIYSLYNLGEHYDHFDPTGKPYPYSTWDVLKGINALVKAIRLSDASDWDCGASDWDCDATEVDIY